MVKEVMRCLFTRKFFLKSGKISLDEKIGNLVELTIEQASEFAGFG